MRCLAYVVGVGLLVLSVCVGACGRPSTLKVTVTGVPMQAVSLVASLALQDDGGSPVLPMPGLDPYTLPQPVVDHTSFVLRLPLSGDTTLLLGIAAFSQAGGTGCLLGLGSVAHPYQTSILDDEVTVALVPYSEDPQTGCQGAARIVAANPTALAAAGGETLQVLGWGFVPGAQVVLNGQPLQTTYISAGQLEVTTPPSAKLAPVPLQVVLPQGPTLSYQGLRYIAKTLSFSLLTSFPYDATYLNVVSADLNGDKQPDLVYYGGNFSAASQISVAIQESSLQFALKQIPIAGGPVDLSICDVDKDGDLDLITIGSSDAAIYVLVNDGQGNFTLQTYPTGVMLTGLISLQAMDLNGDGAPDLLLDNDSKTLHAFPNDGNGGFSAATRQDMMLTAGNYSTTVTSLDYDGDGHLDIVLLGDSTLTVLANPGPVLPKDDGQALEVDLPFNYGGAFRIADVDGDMISDLVLVDEVGTPYLLASTGAMPRQAIQLGSSCPAFSFDAGDLDGDGQTDLAMACDVGGQVQFDLQSPPLNFAVSSQNLQLSASTEYWDARLVDLDGDHRPELILSASNSNFSGQSQVYVYQNISQ